MGAFAQSDQYWLGYVAFCPQTSACRNRVASRGLLETGAGLRGRRHGRRAQSVSAQSLSAGAGGVAYHHTCKGALEKRAPKRPPRGDSCILLFQSARGLDDYAGMRGRGGRCAPGNWRSPLTGRPGRQGRVAVRAPAAVTTPDTPMPRPRPELTRVAHSAGSGGNTRPWVCLCCIAEQEPQDGRQAGREVEPAHAQGRWHARGAGAVETILYASFNAVLS